mmetsp:Transcript_88881/g.157453  ORF Transcript_88881/g.157453 Transcript_88881/m.157453 type:complete len:98 (-) Transcript_88881:51-344(-)
MKVGQLLWLCFLSNAWLLCTAGEVETGQALRGSPGNTRRLNDDDTCSQRGCPNSYQPGYSCQCNSHCEDHGNCCGDFREKCTSNWHHRPNPFTGGLR